MYNISMNSAAFGPCKEGSSLLEVREGSYIVFKRELANPEIDEILPAPGFVSIAREAKRKMEIFVNSARQSIFMRANQKICLFVADNDETYNELLIKTLSRFSTANAG